MSNEVLSAKIAFQGTYAKGVYTVSSLTLPATFVPKVVQCSAPFNVRAGALPGRGAGRGRQASNPSPALRRFLFVFFDFLVSNFDFARAALRSSVDTNSRRL